jgi:pyruvate kinase
MALAPNLKRTKIVATIGPASKDPEVMEAMVRAGVNGLRLNMSHGTHEEHSGFIKTARAISKELGKPLAVIVDIQGPKIRLGELPKEGVVLELGSTVMISHGDTYSVGGPLPVQHDIGKYLKVGEPIFLRDGMVKLEVIDISKGLISGKVLNSGIVFSRQGINLPDTDLGGDIITAKDEADIGFAAEHDVDFVALSFVQTGKDIDRLRSMLNKRNAVCGIIAKIETKAAVENLKEVMTAAEGVMVARGDLAIETQPESVPIIQQRIIERAQRHQKVCIVATQMLESMISSPQPTRAEVSDVATAVMQGADCVMLSGESAMGKYPVETVSLMRKVIVYTERNRPESITAVDFGGRGKRNAISAAAIAMADQIGAKIILAETSSGQTARNLSSFRPDALVVAVTHDVRVFQQLALVWGTRSYLIHAPEQAAEETMRMLRQEHNVKVGDVIIRAWGRQPGVTGGTDTLQIQVV